MKKFLISLSVIVLLLGVAYAAGIGYYAEKFQANTVFGTVDISNLTLEEAQTKIEEELNEQSIILTENGSEIGKIQIGQLNPVINSTAELTETYYSQNPNLWLSNFFTSNEFENNLSKTIEVDPNLLQDQLTELGLNNSEREPARDAEIKYSEAQGYYIEESDLGNQIDFNKLENLITEGIQNKIDSVEVNQAYLDPEVLSDDEQILSIMDQIEEASNVVITLSIAGEEEIISRDLIEDWMYFDDTNQIVYDENAIHEYLGELNDKHASYKKTREFQSTLDGRVTVEPGTLGWSINRELETQSIIEDLQAGVDVTRQPTIDGTGYHQSQEGNDIGDSYVEVSIEHQHMWVYVDGKVVVDTPIVTGQVGTDTVPGAYSIWNKEEDSALEGYNPRTESEYTQPVDYWLPFDDTGQGIHDASWQANFGGDTYQVSGSLGCINTPPEAMVDVFTHAQLGMPVIIY